jgi:beta-glucanase (GH16 family)
VQLVNRSRSVHRAATSQAAKGRTLVFDDEFSTPLSVSANGAGAKYAATKPASWGNSEFGDAVFSDPSKNPQNISVVDGQYLRIRASPLAAGQKDPAGWGRRSRGGIVSSASVPGGGFGAQYGYFEARMLAPASPGTWPAFWMMSSDFLKNSQSGANSEVDAVELYGQDSSYSCHSWHDWRGVAGQKAGRVDCVHALPDWAMTWHTYGVAISKSGVKYYIDGRLVSTGTRPANANDPFYFMLDLSLGGGWPIDLTGVGGTADLYVDYVRVYV